MASRSNEKDRQLFEEYVQTHAVVVKHETADTAQRARTVKPADIKNAVPKDTIDLHGLTVDTAYTALKQFISNSHEANCSPVLIIHGKGLHSGGTGAIKKMTEDYITHRAAPLILSHKSAPPALGGSGATLVWFKKKK